MHKSLCRVATALIIVTLLATSTPSEAQEPVPTAGQAAAILALLVAVGVGAGVGIYYALRTPATIKGCTVSGPNGFTLQEESGPSTVYLLSGATAAIKPGERLKVIGKRQKRTNPTAQRVFVVTGVKGRLRGMPGEAVISCVLRRRWITQAF
jgi:hypothetical protein